MSVSYHSLGYREDAAWLEARREERMMWLREHVQHHLRFYVSVLLGLLVFAIARALAPSLRLILAGDVFFTVYLASSARLVFGATPEDLRQHASSEDEGVIVIIILTLAAVALCLGALFSLLRVPGPPATLSLLLAILSVLLGWFTLHTVAAFRYAHLYYSPAGVIAGDRRDARGLVFPGNGEPDLWEFLYYSFVVGMTAQVSDVQTSNGPMRRTTLAHGVTSFLFNTVILALAVNIASSYVH
jgi:uncharacterized membrane protein